MEPLRWSKRVSLFSILSFLTMVGPVGAGAPGQNYPETPSLKSAQEVKPSFVYLSDLVKEIKGASKPLVIDVRSREEYAEAHIQAAISIPLPEVAQRLGEIPRNRLVVLY